MSILNIPDPQASPSFEDFHILCRICLRKGGCDGVVSVQPIGAYIDRLNPEKVQDLHEKIRMCSNVELHNNDDILPNNICDNCVNLLLIAHYFKLLTAHSDVILRRIVANAKDEKHLPGVKMEWDDQHNLSDYEDREIAPSSFDTDPNSPEHGSFNKTRVYICDVCQLNFSDKSSLSDHMTSHNATSLTDYTRVKDEDSLLVAGHIVLSECEVKPVDRKEGNVSKVMKERKQGKERSGKYNNNDKKSEVCKDEVCKHADDIKKEVDNTEQCKEKDTETEELEDKGYYECLICNTSFSCKQELSRHMYSHDNSNKYKCYGCDVVFDKYSQRTHHEKYCCPNMPPGTKYQCSKCNMKLDERFSYDAHVKFRCVYITNKPQHHTIELEPLHKCSQCKYITKKKGLLKAHMITVHSNQKPYVCEICGKGYSMVSHLTHHHKLSHTHRDKIFKCTSCSYVTNVKGSLKVHMRIHTNERRYSCEICGIHFVHSSGYHVHLRRRHKEKQIECGVCKKMFGVKRDLQEHMSGVHLGLKPFDCKLCGVAYARRKSLKAHSLKIHNISAVRKSSGRKCREDLTESHD